MPRKRSALRRVVAHLVLRRTLLLRLSRDNVSKHIFENVRNLGICALVLGAGHYELRTPVDSGGILHVLAVGFFFTFGSFLYLLNMLNAYEKLKAARFDKNVLLSWGNFYSLFTFVIINSVLRL